VHLPVYLRAKLKSSGRRTVTRHFMDSANIERISKALALIFEAIARNKSASVGRPSNGAIGDRRTLIAFADLLRVIEGRVQSLIASRSTPAEHCRSPYTRI
jgi:hypothetical protein